MKSSQPTGGRGEGAKKGVGGLLRVVHRTLPDALAFSWGAPAPNRCLTTLCGGLSSLCEDDKADMKSTADVQVADER